MSTVAKTHLTPLQYLTVERSAENRSEFYRGKMFAMSGASRRHNLISVNISRRLAEQLDNRDCEVYQSDMRVKVSGTGLYTYPDVVVACEKPEFEDQHVDTLLNPRILVEVLSESTEAYDRGGKWRHYRSLPSLTDYLLVSQESVQIDRYCRTAENQWLFISYDVETPEIDIQSIDSAMLLDQIYAKVQFESEQVD